MSAWHSRLSGAETKQRDLPRFDRKFLRRIIDWKRSTLRGASSRVDDHPRIGKVQEISPKIWEWRQSAICVRPSGALCSSKLPRNVPDSDTSSNLRASMRILDSPNSLEYGREEHDFSFSRAQSLLHRFLRRSSLALARFCTFRVSTVLLHRLSHAWAEQDLPYALYRRFKGRRGCRLSFRPWYHARALCGRGYASSLSIVPRASFSARRKLTLSTVGSKKT